MSARPDDAAGDAASRSALRAWTVVAILFLVQMVNYWDKTVVSLAATPIMIEFGLTPAQYGVIAGAFFALYAVGGIAVALLLAPRMPPRKIMALLLVLWSLLQLPIAFAASYPIIVLCRLLLGFGEGAGAPTAVNAAHEWFPNRERNMPSAIVLLGSTVGSLLAAPILTAVIANMGWRAAFLICSALGVLILMLWLALGRSGPYAAISAQSAVADAAAIRSSAKAVWTDPTILGNVAVGFTAYWIVGFTVGWLAPFATRVMGNAQDAAWAMSGIFALQALCVLAIPFLSERLLMNGVSSRLARGGAMAVCMGGAGLALLAMTLLEQPALILGAMAIAIGLTGPVFPLSSAMISEVAPADRRNSTVTIVLSIITVAAVASSMGTGWLLGASGTGWNAALTLHGFIALAGATAGLIMLHPERSIARRAAAANNANFCAEVRT